MQSTHSPLTEEEKTHLLNESPVPQPARLDDLVFQALGEASLCWSERPTGVFDSTNAKRIGDELIQAISKGEF